MEIGDLVCYAGGVWEIISTEHNWEFDPGRSDYDSKFSLSYIAGPRKDNSVFVTGVFPNEIIILNAMEVIALSATDG